MKSLNPPKAADYLCPLAGRGLLLARLYTIIMIDPGTVTLIFRVQQAL
jgi:hypothetical protein